MGLSFSLAMWGDLRPFLAQRRRLILLDNRGAGKSDTPMRPFSIASMAADAICVMDEAGVAAADVFGMSMGGMISQELGIRHPDRVRSLILGCTTCGGHRGAWPSPIALRPLTDPFLTRAARVRKVIPILFDSHTPPARIERDIELLKANRPGDRGYLMQLGAILAWTSWERLPKVAARTLVIHGDNDRLVPPGNGQILASRIPNAQLVMLKDAGHIFPTDQPEATREALLGFLGAPEGTV
jgi:pimeloyl-ACP methyl ester carboxylesterase